MSRTKNKNHGKASKAKIVENRFAISSESVVYKLPWRQKNLRPPSSCRIS